MEIPNYISRAHLAVFSIILPHSLAIICTGDVPRKKKTVACSDIETNAVLLGQEAKLLTLIMAVHEVSRET